MDILNATHIENLLKDLLGQIIKKKAEAFWSFSFVLDPLLLTQLYILILEEGLMHPELLFVLLAWGEGCSVPEKPDRGISAVPRWASCPISFQHFNCLVDSGLQRYMIIWLLVRDCFLFISVCRVYAHYCGMVANEVLPNELG